MRARWPRSNSTIESSGSSLTVADAHEKYIEFYGYPPKTPENLQAYAKSSLGIVLKYTEVRNYFIAPASTDSKASKKAQPSNGSIPEECPPSVDTKRSSMSCASIASLSDISSNRKPTSTKSSDTARLWKLEDVVDEVTSHPESEVMQTLSALFLCHKLFTNSVDLLKAFRRQFKQQPSLGSRKMTPTLEALYHNPSRSKSGGSATTSKRTSISETRSHNFSDTNALDPNQAILFIQIRVVNVVRHWVKTYWKEDFARNVAAQTQLQSLINDIDQNMDGPQKKSLTKQLQSTVDTQKQSNPRRATQIESKTEEIEDIRTSPLLIDRWPYLKNIKNAKAVTKHPQVALMSIDPNSIAEQLTLMNFHIFKLIQKRECIKQAWKKEDKWKRAPNVLRMIGQSNSESKWVKMTLLEPQTSKKRAAYITHMVKVMKRFQQIRNFASLFAFYTALDSIVIKKCKATWARLPKSTLRDIEAFGELFGWRMQKFQENQATLASPAVPHLGCFLQVLFGIEEGNKQNEFGNGVINYNKMLGLALQIDRLMIFKHGVYELKQDLFVQHLLVTDFTVQSKISEKIFDRLSDAITKQEKIEFETPRSNVLPFF